MGGRKERENIRLMLTDTIKLMVKNGLTFKRKFNVEGLLGITVDDGEVFLVSMNELVRSDLETETSLQLAVEHVESDCEPTCSSVIKIRPGQGSRKRARVSDESCDSSLPDNEDLYSEPVSPGERVAKPATSVSNISSTLGESPKLPNDFKIKKEIDAELWLEENNYPGAQYDHVSQHSPFSDSMYASTSATAFNPGQMDMGNDGYYMVEDPNDPTRLIRNTTGNKPEISPFHSTSKTGSESSGAWCQSGIRLGDTSKAGSSKRQTSPTVKVEVMEEPNQPVRKPRQAGAKRSRAYRKRKKEAQGEAYMLKERERAKRRYVPSNSLTPEELAERRKKNRDYKRARRAEITKEHIHINFV